MVDYWEDYLGWKFLDPALILLTARGLLGGLFGMTEGDAPELHNVTDMTDISV